MQQLTTAADRPRYLLISAHHDYRTARRSSIHFIGDELAKRGQLHFFSMRYSQLSRHKGDIRSELDGCANVVGTHHGVQCFLWKTLIHPMNLHLRWLRPLERLLFSIYRSFTPPILADWIRQADMVFYESGIAPIHFDLAKRLNPKARHIYLCNDDLRAIDAADYAVRNLNRIAPLMDALILVARDMANGLPRSAPVFFVPHGMDASLNLLGDPSPYGPGIHVASIGSMLFDTEFVVIASHAFPRLTFHIIGSGHPHCARYGPNVLVYEHMAYNKTIRYIKHAQIGIAPYGGVTAPSYLMDSSMKMLQYDFFGLPTVCPESVTGTFHGRFGYIPGDVASIHAAITRALEAPRVRSRKILSWSEVTDRHLHPEAFADTAL